MIDKEVIILVLAPIIMGLIWWYQDKRREKKDREKLSKRLGRGY